MAAGAAEVADDVNHIIIVENDLIVVKDDIKI